MQYQSIIRFFEYAHIDYNSAADFNLTRAKKLVNAEFAMEADGFIAIDNFSYSKNDLLAEIERPDFLQRLEHHKRIWEQPSLLNLLEKDRIDLNERPAWFHLAYAANFKSFVSEYFAPVFDRNMRLLLGRNDLSAAERWMDYTHFIQPENEEEAFRSTRLYLTETIRFFKNLNDQSFKDRAGELYMWHNSHWAIFINKLPDSLLAYVDELISTIISFTVRIQNADRRICFNISKEMLLVKNANFTLTKLVISNHEIYKKNYESRTVKGRLSNINYIYVIIVVLFWVSRIFMSSDDKQDSFKFRELPPNQTTITTDTTGNADINVFQFQRTSYFNTYNRQRQSGFFAKDSATLSATPFVANKVYLFIEGHDSGPVKLDTIGLENLTQKDILVDILWSGKVYHHIVQAGAYIGFAAGTDKNMDLVIEFNAINDSTVKTNALGDSNQYIHVRKSMDGDLKDISDEFCSPGEIPYLLHSQLKELPVYFKIREKNGNIYFDMQSKGVVLNAISSSSLSL